MKKVLLLTSLIVSSLCNNLFGQDYSSYCSTTRTDGILSGGKGVKSVASANGEITAMVDTLATTQAIFTWSINEFWMGGAPISDSVFTLKVKSSFSGSFRIGILSDGFSKTYDVPFLSNKLLVGGADYVDYSFTASGPASFNAKKFQQILFYVIPAADVVMGTVSITELSYGTNGCNPTSVNDANDVISNVRLFPNPANGNEVNVDATFKKSVMAKVMVSNALGQIVYTSNDISATNYKNTIVTSEWSKGLYAVTVIADGIPVKTEMLVVQ